MSSDPFRNRITRRDLFSDVATGLGGVALDLVADLDGAGFGVPERIGLLAGQGGNRDRFWPGEAVPDVVGEILEYAAVFQPDLGDVVASRWLEGQRHIQAL